MIENDYIDYNPCRKVKKYTEDNERSVILPEEVQEEFLTLLPTEQIRVIVLILLHTGFRKSNVLGLCKKHINIEKNI